MKTIVCSALVVAYVLTAVPGSTQSSPQTPSQSPGAANPSSNASQNPVLNSAGSQPASPATADSPSKSQPATGRGPSSGKVASSATSSRPKKSDVPIDNSYVIGAQDVLAIDVWQEKELSVRAHVRPDGKITLPLVNDIQAAGLKPTELKEIIEKDLAKYVTDPHVSVIVEQINSRYVYMSGEVGRPGIVPLVRTTTVLQALTLVGGPNQFANTKKIYVMRTVNGKTVKFPFDYKKALKEGPGKDNIILQPGDTVVVP